MKRRLLNTVRWLFLPPGSRSETAEDIRIARILNGANLLGMILLLLAAQYIICSAEYDVFVFNTIIFAMLVLNFTLYKILQSLRFYKTLSTVIAVIYGLYNFMYGGFSGLGQLWLLVMPPVFYIFTGYIRGILISVSYLAVYTGFFLTGNCLLAGTPCTPDFIFTFTLIYVFITILSFLLEYSRFRAQKNYNDLIENLDLLSRTDELTGLLNRRGIKDFLKYEFRRHLRDETRFTICFCDIDHFKKINDTYGHDAGDAVLSELSRFIKQQLRAGDFISRWGGEEFIILMRDTGAEDGAMIIERLRQSIEARRFDTGTTQIRVTLSFGLSETGEAATLEDLIDRADDRLYRAKEQGRNRVIYS